MPAAPRARRTSQDPRNHHFVPEFFIRRWADAEDRVWAYRYPYKDKLEIKQLPPSAIGFERDLYAMSEGSPGDRQRIERETTQRIDSDGATALSALLESGKRPKSEELVSAWVELIASLISRSPSRLREISGFATAQSFAPNDVSRQRYLRMRAPDWPATFDEAIAASRTDAFDHDLGKLTAERLFKAPRFKSAISDMHWKVRRVSQGRSLLLSDHPVTYSSLETSGAVVVMPIGPSEAFVAARDDAFFQNLLAMPEDLFVNTLNKRVVTQAHAYVFARDRADDALIKATYVKA